MTELRAGPQSLAALEVVIEQGIRTFMDVGAALLAIRDGRLYREQGHQTFEDYCQKRWGWSGHRARQYIEAANVGAELERNHGYAPANERQARELARLPDSEARAEVWAEVQAEHGEQLTAADVREAVDRHPSAPPRTPRAEPVRAVPEPDSSFPDAEAGEQYQCARCNGWYAASDGECPHCDSVQVASGPPSPEPLDLPPAHLSPEQKAFYKIAGCVHMAGLDPSTVAAVPDAALLGPSVKELAGLAEWLQGLVSALRARQARPDLHAVQ